jgi:K+-transporting ATPase KdpF subunit
VDPGETAATLASMSIESGLLIALVAALVAYLVAALIFPERF